MSRQRLANRRRAELVTFEHSGRRWTAGFARFANGNLAEIFLDAPKESPLGDAVRETAIVVSLALQAGCDAATITHALTGRDASPVGAALALIATTTSSTTGERLK